jgi:hypothetical protein
MAAVNRAASAKYRAAPGSPSMYPRAYVWIRVTTNVTIRSITIARGSIRIPTLKLANHGIDW